MFEKYPNLLCVFISLILSSGIPLSLYALQDRFKILCDKVKLKSFEIFITNSLFRVVDPGLAGLFWAVQFMYNKYVGAPADVATQTRPQEYVASSAAINTEVVGERKYEPYIELEKIC